MSFDRLYLSLKVSLVRLWRHRFSRLSSEPSHDLDPSAHQRTLPRGRRFDDLRNGSLLQRFSRMPSKMNVTWMEMSE